MTVKTGRLIILAIISTLIQCEPIFENQTKLQLEKTHLIDSINAIAFELRFSNPDSAYIIANNNLNNSNIINYSKGIAESCRVLGIIAMYKGNNLKSYEMLNRSLEIYQKTKNESGEANLWKNLGNLYSELNDNEEAINCCNKILESEYIHQNPKLKAEVNLNLAILYNKEEKYEEANYLLTNSLSLFESLLDTTNLIATYINLGETNEFIGNNAEALSYYNKCEMLLSQKNIPVYLMYTYQYKGKLLYSEKKFSESVSYLKEAYVLANSLDIIDAKREISYYLYKYYNSLNDSKTALNYLTIKNNLDEQLNQIETNKIIDKNKLQQHKEEALNELKNRTILIYISLVFLLISLLFLLTLYWNYRNKQRANKLLTEMDELKTKLYSNITHELRTPLTLILGPLEQMLSSDAQKKPSRKQVKMMRKNANNLLNLVNQMLDLSKIDANSLKLELEETDIVKFVKIRFAAFASLAEQKNIRYYYYFPDEKRTCVFDGGKLEKIINNLVSNALKFTSAGGEVSCRLEFLKNNQIQVRVSDTGQGIPENELDKIFDRFHQVGGSGSYNKTGTGIGLSLTRELVELMHGKINVNSQLGRGTDFTVILPLGTSHLNKNEYEFVKGYSSSNEVVETTKETGVKSFDCPSENGEDNDIPMVLLVEDHAEISDFIEENIRDGYKILRAENGAAGLKQATEKIPDLIVSDVVMPEMDGFELCKKLKTDERTSHIPVILLTAKSSDNDKLTGLETGADAYLTKPFSMKELRVRIKMLIEQRRKLRERFKNNLNLEPREIAVTSADERFISRALEIIEKNMGNAEFEVRQFQEEMFMSRMQLFRKIKALTNQTPGEFIRTLRLKRAAQLMDQNFGNIAQVTFEVGFNNPSYFAKCFKEMFGKLPSEYLKNHEENS